MRPRRAWVSSARRFPGPPCVRHRRWRWPSRSCSSCRASGASPRRGLNPQEVATAVRAFTGGLFVSEYFDGNQRYDVILRAPRWQYPERLAATPIATPLAGAQTIGELAEIRRTVGPTQLARVDGQRTVSLLVLPPE